MNKELEIRAAKALGWREMDSGWFTDFGPAHVKIIQASMKGMVNVTCMQFTTSYDWAMLGVKAINEIGGRHNFYKAIWAQMDGPNPKIHVLNATPEQITQA